MRPSRTMVRMVGGVAASGLAACASLHVVWLSSPWPFADWPAWSRAFGSSDFRVSDGIMLSVAALFAVAACLVAACAGLLPRLGPRWLYRLGSWGVAVVLVGRAAVGFVEMPATLHDPATPASFRETIRLYLMIYLPIFAVLGALSGYVAARSSSRGTT